MKVSLCGQRRIWPDWADAQTDLSLRLVHIYCCCGFVVRHLDNYDLI